MTETPSCWLCVLCTLLLCTRVRVLLQLKRSRTYQSLFFRAPISLKAFRVIFPENVQKPRTIPHPPANTERCDEVTSRSANLFIESITSQLADGRHGGRF